MKRFVIRKYVDASDVLDAIRREPSAPVDDVYLDSPSESRPADCIGFRQPTQSSFEFEDRKRR